MPIPRGTRRAVGLREVAKRLGVARVTVKRWWLDGRLIGRPSEAARPRVIVPVEVVDYYLRYFKLPSKLELYEAGALSREFLLELAGPDGGLSELEDEARKPEVVEAEAPASSSGVWAQ